MKNNIKNTIMTWLWQNKYVSKLETVSTLKKKKRINHFGKYTYFAFHYWDRKIDFNLMSVH